jgi:hypothetical protein
MTRGSAGAEYTPADAAWLQSVRQRLDTHDTHKRITGVAARDPSTGTPQVLTIHPLRTTDRSAHRVPWVNIFWLTDPTLIRDIGRLETSGYIDAFCARLASDADAFAQHVRVHGEYAAERWALLSEADQAYAVAEGYDRVLRLTGVGGLRYPNQIKCLHQHYAHHLATGRSLIGAWVQQALDAGGASGSRSPLDVLAQIPEWKPYLAVLAAPPSWKDMPPLSEGWGGAEGASLCRERRSAAARAPARWRGRARWWTVLALAGAAVAAAAAIAVATRAARGGRLRF